MSISFLDLEIAKQKLQLKSSTSFLSFFSTLWKGEVIMCSFSHLNNSVVGLFCASCLDEEEINKLEEIIKNYLN